MPLYQCQESTEVPRKASISSAQNGFLYFSQRRLEIGHQYLLLPQTAFWIFKLARYVSQINLMEFPIQLIS